MNDVRMKSIGSKLIFLIIVLNIISFINMSLFGVYERIAFYINIPILIFILFSQNKIYKHEQAKLLFAIVFTAYGMITLFFTGGGLGSVLTPVYSMLVLLVLTRCSFTKNMIKLLVIILVAMNLFLVFNSQGYYIKAMYNKASYLNSNTIAMVITYTAIYSIIFIKSLKIKYSKILTILLLAISTWGILNCQARGSMLTLFAFVVLDTLVPKVFWKNRVRTILITITIIGLGLIIPYIYVSFYHNGMNFVIPFTSKSLYTGREVIWSNFYSYIGDSAMSFMLGLGSKVILWDAGNINLHNNYLAVISNFGVIGFVMYYGYILKIISDLYKKSDLTNYQISLLIGFICVLINGFIEVSTLWHIMFYFNFMFLGLAANEIHVITKSEIVVVK